MEVVMNRIKELRIESNKTQNEIAGIVDTSQSNYSKYELGTIEPDINTLIKLADYYNVSLDFLCGRQFCTDLGIVTPKQHKLFRMIQTLDNDRFYLLYGYTERLLKEA